jgi:HPt (histidine-containing phosphotransfer) domain-containing protein
MTKLTDIKLTDMEMGRRIQALWERAQGQVESRLQLLDRAAAANRTGAMGAELQQEAREIAHKLAGSLGMFGFPTSSEIARRLESLCESDAPDPELMAELMVELRGSLVDPVQLSS